MVELKTMYKLVWFSQENHCIKSMIQRTNYNDNLSGSSSHATECCCEKLLSIRKPMMKAVGVEASSLCRESYKKTAAQQTTPKRKREREW